MCACLQYPLSTGLLCIGTDSEHATQSGANGNSNGSSTNHSECDSMRNHDNSSTESHQLTRNNSGPQGTFKLLHL